MDIIVHNVGHYGIMKVLSGIDYINHRFNDAIKDNDTEAMRYIGDETTAINDGLEALAVLLEERFGEPYDV